MEATNSPNQQTQSTKPKQLTAAYLRLIFSRQQIEKGMVILVGEMMRETEGTAKKKTEMA